MRVDILRLAGNLNAADAEPTVPLGEVNLYLLENVIRPLRQGVRVRYGDIDYAKFDIDDLRVAAHYTDQQSDVSNTLERLLDKVIEAKASACKTRAFC